MSPAARLKAWREAIARRRAFRLPGYVTLAEAGFDGEYVSPIQIASGALDGPMIVSKDWLDAPSARRHHAELSRQGYLDGTPFNRVLDRALALVGLTRADIYVAPVFALLPPRRSTPIPAAHARASFDAVVRHELLGRRPVALGHDAARTLAHFGIEHLTGPHPSSRGASYEDRAQRIAQALRAA